MCRVENPPERGTSDAIDQTSVFKGDEEVFSLCSINLPLAET